MGWIIPSRFPHTQPHDNWAKRRRAAAAVNRRPWCAHLNWFARKVRIEHLIDGLSPFQGDLVTGADEADAATDQVEAWSSGLQSHVLHRIGLIQHPCDALKHRILQQVKLPQHRME